MSGVRGREGHRSAAPRVLGEPGQKLGSLIVGQVGRVFGVERCKTCKMNE